MLIPLGRVQVTPFPSCPAPAVFAPLPHKVADVMKPPKPSASRCKPSRPAARAPRDKPVPLTVQHPHAAGIDVHSDMHMVCVPADRDPQPVRRFGANTCDLEAIADWLRVALRSG